MNVVVEDRHASPNEGGLLGFPGSDATLRIRMDACLERVIHFLETSTSVSVEAPSHQRDEQTAESPPLNEPRARWPEWLILPVVLVVEALWGTHAAHSTDFADRAE